MSKKNDTVEPYEKTIVYDNAVRKKCPLCGGSQVVKIGKPNMTMETEKIIKEDYWVVRCKKCRFYFVHPDITFSENEWKMLYGTDYFDKLPKWWAQKRSRDRRQRLTWLKYGCQHEVEKFLDIGCGEGYTLIEARKRGWDVWGIDIIDSRVEKAQIKEINFFKGDIFKVNFPNDYFDCIYMDSTLEHLLDPVSQLIEIQRILKKEGTLYIGVPNEECLFNDVKQILYFLLGRPSLSARLIPFKRPYHVVGFTKKSLFTILSKCNFDVVMFRNFAGEYDWLRFKVFSKPFLVNILLLPVHIIAIPLRKRIYFEMIVRRPSR